MTIRYPKWRAYTEFSIALVMLIALYIGTNPAFWGWLLFLPLFFIILYKGVLLYSYSLTIDGDRIVVGGIKCDEYRISDISAIDVWFAKGGRMAVVTFTGRETLSFPGKLIDFDRFVELLRTKANLPAEPEQKS